eukprot:TRINITY_DN619_c1_g2_i1.p1 TRINITY_DN619_c1_g2~~TRINITY_DN619_c1_g2_i1.p1  ORF type:complete len:2206 (-),score=680.94 TRINITY_DN619_c1_g2_i1:51-5771(-)
MKVADPKRDAVRVVVKDKDTLSKDEVVGIGALPLDGLKAGTPEERVVELKPQGSVLLRITPEGFSGPKALDETRLEELVSPSEGGPETLSFATGLNASVQPDALAKAKPLSPETMLETAQTLDEALEKLQQAPAKVEPNQLAATLKKALPALHGAASSLSLPEKAAEALETQLVNAEKLGIKAVDAAEEKQRNPNPPSDKARVSAWLSALEVPAARIADIVQVAAAIHPDKLSKISVDDAIKLVPTLAKRNKAAAADASAAAKAVTSLKKPSDPKLDSAQDQLRDVADALEKAQLSPKEFNVEDFNTIFPTAMGEAQAVVDKIHDPKRKKELTDRIDAARKAAAILQAPAAKLLSDPESSAVSEVALVASCPALSGLADIFEGVELKPPSIEELLATELKNLEPASLEDLCKLIPDANILATSIDNPTLASPEDLGNLGHQISDIDELLNNAKKDPSKFKIKPFADLLAKALASGKLAADQIKDPKKKKAALDAVKHAGKVGAKLIEAAKALAADPSNPEKKAAFQLWLLGTADALRKMRAAIADGLDELDDSALELKVAPANDKAKAVADSLPGLKATLTGKPAADLENAPLDIDALAGQIEFGLNNLNNFDIVPFLKAVGRVVSIAKKRAEKIKDPLKTKINNAANHLAKCGIVCGVDAVPLYNNPSDAKAKQKLATSLGRTLTAARDLAGLFKFADLPLEIKLEAVDSDQLSVPLDNLLLSVPTADTELVSLVDNLKAEPEAILDAPGLEALKSAPKDAASLEDLLKKAQDPNTVDLARLLALINQVVGTSKSIAAKSPSPEKERLNALADMLGRTAIKFAQACQAFKANPDDPKLKADYLKWLAILLQVLQTLIPLLKLVSDKYKAQIFNVPLYSIELTQEELAEKPLSDLTLDFAAAPELKRLTIALETEAKKEGNPEILLSKIGPLLRTITTLLTSVSHAPHLLDVDAFIKAVSEIVANCKELLLFIPESDRKALLDALNLLVRISMMIVSIVHQLRKNPNDKKLRLQFTLYLEMFVKCLEQCSKLVANIERKYGKGWETTSREVDDGTVHTLSVDPNDLTKKPIADVEKDVIKCEETETLLTVLKDTPEKAENAHLYVASVPSDFGNLLGQATKATADVASFDIAAFAKAMAKALSHAFAIGKSCTEPTTGARIIFLTQFVGRTAVMFIDALLKLRAKPADTNNVARVQLWAQVLPQATAQLLEALKLANFSIGDAERKAEVGLTKLTIPQIIAGVESPQLTEIVDGLNLELKPLDLDSVSLQTEIDNVPAQIGLLTSLIRGSRSDPSTFDISGFAKAILAIITSTKKIANSKGISPVSKDRLLKALNVAVRSALMVIVLALKLKKDPKNAELIAQFALWIRILSRSLGLIADALRLSIQESTTSTTEQVELKVDPQALRNQSLTEIVSLLPSDANVKSLLALLEAKPETLKEGTILKTASAIPSHVDELKVQLSRLQAQKVSEWDVVSLFKLLNSLVSSGLSVAATLPSPELQAQVENIFQVFGRCCLKLIIYIILLQKNPDNEDYRTQFELWLQVILQFIIRVVKVIRVIETTFPSEGSFRRTTTISYTADPNVLMKKELSVILGELEGKGPIIDTVVELINATSVKGIKRADALSSLGPDLSKISSQCKEKKLDNELLLKALRNVKSIALELKDRTLLASVEFGFKFYSRVLLQVFSFEILAKAEPSKKAFYDIWIEVLGQAVNRLIDAVNAVIDNINNGGDPFSEPKAPASKSGTTVSKVEIDPNEIINKPTAELVSELEKDESISALAKAIDVAAAASKKGTLDDAKKALPLLKELKPILDKAKKDGVKTNEKELAARIITIIDHASAILHLISEDTRGNFLMPINFLGKGCMQLISFLLEYRSEPSKKPFFDVWVQLLEQASSHMSNALSQLG